MRFLACALLVIATTHATKVCTRGEKKQEGSNTCFCLGDGLEWVCAPGGSSPLFIPRNQLLTEKRQVDEFETNTLVQKARNVKDPTCEPGKYFKVECNNCLCGSDGIADLAICTKVSCRPKFCVPGSVFKYYCNTCVCPDDGSRDNASCTRMSCDESEWNVDGTRKYNPNSISFPLLKKREAEEGRCNTGAIFRNYCNYCFCGTDGTIAGSPCTAMACDLAVWNKDGTKKSPFDDNVTAK